MEPTHLHETLKVKRKAEEGVRETGHGKDWFAGVGFRMEDGCWQPRSITVTKGREWSSIYSKKMVTLDLQLKEVNSANNWSRKLVLPYSFQKEKQSNDTLIYSCGTHTGPWPTEL
jgi:hypothetical protein